MCQSNLWGKILHAARPTKLIEKKICRTDLVSKIPQHLWFQVLEQLGCDSHLQEVNIFWLNSSWSLEILRMSKRVCWLSQKLWIGKQIIPKLTAPILSTTKYIWNFIVLLVNSICLNICLSRKGSHFLWTWSGWRFDLTKIFKKCFSLPSK